MPHGAQSRGALELCVLREWSAYNFYGRLRLHLFRGAQTKIKQETPRHARDETVTYCTAPSTNYSKIFAHLLNQKLWLVLGIGSLTPPKKKPMNTGDGNNRKGAST